eukprot:TRINITY_DN63479_c0_g1_i1.p1 TRINITY_DN63479_c0_g1~~TRINITY_DN63479_c0_g1_i1.p1  ORF type:complete len:325 (+),score=44.97 TRINITY_DN63479_c0_g1_i1:26-976(+)
MRSRLFVYSQWILASICGYSASRSKSQGVQLPPPSTQNAVEEPPQDVVRILYLCHRPEDGGGHAGFVFQNGDGVETMKADQVNKHVVLPLVDVKSRLEYVFMDPAFDPEHMPFRLATWNKEKYAHVKPKLLDAITAAEWSDLVNSTHRDCYSFASAIPPSEDAPATARALCAEEEAPCFHAVVSVACPTFEEDNILALNRELLVPGGMFFAGDGHECTAKEGFEHRLVGAGFIDERVDTEPQICVYARSNSSEVEQTAAVQQAPSLKTTELWEYPRKDTTVIFGDFERSGCCRRWGSAFMVFGAYAILKGLLDYVA